MAGSSPCPFLGWTLWDSLCGKEFLSRISDRADGKRLVTGAVLRGRIIVMKPGDKLLVDH